MEYGLNEGPVSAQDKQWVKTLLWVNERRVQCRQRELSAAQTHEKRSEDRVLEAGTHLKLIANEMECRRRNLIEDLKAAVTVSSSLRRYGKQVTDGQAEVVKATTELTDSQNTLRKAAEDTAKAQRLLKVQLIRQEKWLLLKDRVFSRSGG